MTIAAHGITDRGIVRPHNEDALHLDAEHGVFAVADGMGGHAAGEVASGLAVDALKEVFSQPRTSEVDYPALFRSAFEEANARIAQRIRENPECTGMGTTAVVAVVDGRRLWIAHVGDSRAYRIRNGMIEQLTSDHSFVNELVRLGMLSREQAARDPRRNVVTRALGSGPSVVPDVFHDMIQPGDIIVLCSDGLNTMLDDASILEEVERAGDDMERVCQSLVEAANQAGGEDNVTVVAASYVGAAETSTETTLPVASASEEGSEVAAEPAADTGPEPGNAAGDA